MPSSNKLGLPSALRLAALAILAALAPLNAGCGPKLTPPSSFAELDSGHYDYRAATPAGVVVAARSERNELHADLDFWSRAVDSRLKRDGYVRTTDVPTAIATNRGLQGVELRYAHEQDGRAYDYVVALFVKPSRVYVVEAAGDKEDFAPATADIEGAIRSLRE
jgi:hypothetical protein